VPPLTSTRLSTTRSSSASDHRPDRTSMTDLQTALAHVAEHGYIEGTFLDDGEEA
jgi:hypothetical protein